MGTSRRFAASLLLLAGLAGGIAVRTAHAQAAGEIAGIPATGAMGLPETVAEIMRRQAALGTTGVLKDQESEIQQPDRTGLPQNPNSPDVPAFPALPPGFQPSSGGTTTLSPQTVGVNFTAATLSGVNPTFSFPPDCMGAIGPSQFIVFVNGRLVSFSKTTGVADGVLNVDPDTFFNSVRNGSRTSDPRIRYDRLTARWILTIINVSTPNRILLAVSDAASAGVITGSTVFTYFFIPIDSTPPAISSTCLADYPTLGVDANALYIGTNNFCGSPSQTFNSTDGYVVRKTSVLGAGPIVVTVFRGLVATASSAGPYTPQGVDNFDPASTEGYFIGVDNLSFGLLQMRRVSTPGGTPSVSADVSITVPTTTFPIRVPHLGNTGGASGQLSALDDRLFAAHIRNGRLWTAHNIQVNSSGAASSTGGRNGSRWYELSVPVGSGTPTIVQSGTIFDPAATNPRSYWIPSVMVTGQGHAAFGFSSAGSADRANSATVGRLVGDALGTTQTPLLYTSSATAYNPPSDPGGPNGRRWGDYSYTSVDPSDDQTMWTVQMFCDATNSYGVRVAKLIPPPPATPSSLPDVTAGQNPVNVTLTGLSTSGSGFWDPGPNLPGVPAFNHIAAAASNGGATGTPPTVVSATYVNPTTVNLVLDASTATANIGTEKYTITVTNPDGQTAAGAVLHVVGGTPVATMAAGPSLAEGNSGTTAFNFTVNLSSAAPAMVTVNYQTGDGTATVADNDYQAATSFITIPAGSSSGTITVNVNGDTKFEANETFTVAITSVTNATLGSPSSATGTIVNDDTAPTVTLAAGPAHSEGNAGTTPFNFTVNLSGASGLPVTVNYQTGDSTATTADNDYVGAATFITIPAGLTTGTIPVTVNGDTKYETDELFIVRLTSATGATLGAAIRSVGTIQNDDLPPSVSVDSVSHLEGNSGTTAFTFTVSLSQASGVAAAVNFATADSSATLAGNDYQAASGTLNFAPGVTSQPFTVLVNGDVTQEPDEYFIVGLTNLVNLQPGTVRGIGTIQNDDSVPSLSINSVSQAEGNSGTTPFTFTVSLSNPTTSVVTAHYQTADGTATLADSDYVAASGTLTIPALASSVPVVVRVKGDVCGEPDETFTVTLSAPSGATIGTGTGTGTILNDDDATPPTVAVLSPNGGEVLSIGTLASLTWNATDNVAVTTVDLLLSRDGGLTYPEVLATGLANSGQFWWTVTGPGSSTADCFLQARAHDASCNAGRDVSDAAFQITTVSAVPALPSVSQFALGAIEPNPTSGAAQIQFELPREAAVRLSVLDIQGREVARLVDRSYPAGRYEATWSGQTPHGTAAMGVYFVHYEAGGKSITKKLVLTR